MEKTTLFGPDIHLGRRGQRPWISQYFLIICVFPDKIVVGRGDRIGNWVTANYDGSSLTWKNLSSRHFQYKGSQVEKYLHIVSSFLKKVELSNIVEKYGLEWSKMYEKTQELSLHNVTPPQSVPNTSLMKSCQKYEQLWEIRLSKKHYLACLQKLQCFWKHIFGGKDIWGHHASEVHLGISWQDSLHAPINS